MHQFQKWFTAVRPFAYTASVTPAILGLALSFHSGFPVKWGPFVITVLGLIFFHSAANLLNDCFDFGRGLDSEILPTSGAIIRGWLTENQALAAAIMFMLAGVLCGSILIFHAGWVVLVLGCAGSLLVITYTTPGVCLKYCGLGDVAIFLAFGPLPTFGTWWVQTETFSWLPIIWCIPLACFTTGILHANNWRDISTDSKQGCNTLAVKLRNNGSALYYRVLIIIPFVHVLILASADYLLFPNRLAPLTVLGVFLSLPLAFKLLHISNEQNVEKFQMLDGLTAQTQLVFGLLLPAAFVISTLCR